MEIVRGIDPRDEIICNVTRDSEENKRNLKEVERVLTSLLGYKVQLSYKEE